MWDEFAYADAVQAERNAAATLALYSAVTGIGVGCLLVEACTNFSFAAPGLGADGIGTFTRLSNEDNAAINAILGHSRTQSRIKYSWQQTLATGNEHGFFIFLNSSHGGNYNFTLSKVYIGTDTDMSGKFSWHARLYGNFFAYLHTHPGFDFRSQYPSTNDLIFGKLYGAITILRSWNGVSYGQ